MDTIQVLDVSLRDGGHRSNFHFQDRDLKNILQKLDISGIEYIEIGYRNGSLHPIPNIGPAGLCAKEYLLQCQSLIKNAKIAVMLHPENVKEADLVELKSCGVRLIRICIAVNAVEAAFPILELCQKLQFETSANFIHMSYYQDAERDKVVASIVKHKPDVIYFADSNGSMKPDKIQSIYKKYTKTYSIPFGFHAHDNLGLAQANAIAAINNGVQWIDVSLAGMGKGIGNLKTEFFIAYLHAIHNQKYQLETVVEAANYVRKELGIGHEEITMDEFVRGISDFSTADLKTHKARNQV